MAECRGIGHSVQRKEDARFIRGQGRYIDDIKLPGMLYLDIARSPYAHAKITKIHEDTATSVPGVAAVITGKTLEGFKLAWMPTLMSDQQMVLPVDTVKYQAQEVAAIVATSRYAAADGVAALEVDYDPLPVVVDPHEALKPGATKVRDDKESNHIFHWEHGDADATERSLAGCDTVVKQKMHLPRIHVASIETCGCVASWNPVEGHLTLYLTTQAPHAIRTVVALVTAHLGLEEQKIRVISPDIGGGFGGKVPVYPGYVLAIAASVVTGKPVKWIEDRSENLQADSFARDYHISATLGSKKRQGDGAEAGHRCRSRLLRRGGQSVEVSRRALPHRFRVLRSRKRPRGGGRGVYEQAAGRNRLPVFVPGNRGGACDRADGGSPGPRERGGPRRLPPPELHQTGAVPLYVGPRLGVRQRQLRGGARKGHGHDRLRGASRRAGRKARARRADGDRDFVVHGDRRGRAVQDLRHPGHQDVRFERNPDPPHRKGDRPLRNQIPGPGARNHLCPDHRRGTRDPTRAHPGRRGGYRHRSLRPRNLREPFDPRRGSSRGDGCPEDPGEGEKDRCPPAGGRRGRSRVGAGEVLREGLPRPGQDHPGHRLRGLHEPPPGDGSGARSGFLLRPAEPDLPVRVLHLLRGH